MAGKVSVGVSAPQNKATGNHVDVVERVVDAAQRTSGPENYD